MIYLIVGASCAGKSSFVKNSFLKGKNHTEFRDLMTITETDDCYLIGTYVSENRTVGTDRVSRADIPKFFEQIKRLYGKGKDIVLEGDKICSHKFFGELAESGFECKLYWIRCKTSTSIARNKANNTTCSESYLTAVASKARNIFYDFCFVFDGEIFDTDDITDFSNFSKETAKPVESSKKMRDDFAVFILSHGRADNMRTLKPLLRGGYTGKWYIVIDNEDKTADEYRKLYGDRVIVFDKLAVSETFDTGDNFPDRCAVVYARRACFDIAEKMGIKYFLQLDDDYQRFLYRWIDGDLLASKDILKLDKVFEAMICFLDETDTTTIAFAQGGDFIGGTKSANANKGMLRKAMNTFFCRTDRRIDFIGKQNEDVSTYVRWGGTGQLFFTFTGVNIVQIPTQSLSGGMTALYRDGGTFIKSFYTVMYCPSCVKVAMMGDVNYRLHHNINWRCAVPKILSEDWKIQK